MEPETLGLEAIRGRPHVLRVTDGEHSPEKSPPSTSRPGPLAGSPLRTVKVVSALVHDASTGTE